MEGKMKNNLRHLFRSIFQKHRSVLQNHLDQYDLYVGQPRYLRLIKENPGITQKQLVSHLNLSKETVSVTLKKLEHGQYIVRKVNENDRREKHLYLSDKGLQIVLDLNEYFERIENAMFASLTHDEQVQLENFFNIMLRELENGEKNEEIL